MVRSAVALSRAGLAIDDGQAMKRAKLHPPPLPKVRNAVARSPLLGKGGPHGKTVAAKRRQANIDMKRRQRDPHAEE